MRKAVADRLVSVYVLHRVLYPQVHVNGAKKKKKKKFLLCSKINLIGEFPPYPCVNVPEVRPIVVIQGQSRKSLLYSLSVAFMTRPSWIRLY
jgi:hypothetical protein